MTTSDDATRPTLLLVTGAGRSGTSTIAGSLNRLGFVVPTPEVPADDSNPRGFYEPQWAVDFHKRIFREIKVRTNDARPAAADLAAAAAASPELLSELTEWLESLADHERVVVKDPRTFWVHDLWRTAAAQAGFDLAFITMLRPPAEVAKSRDQHYLAAKDEALRRARETTNVASWCHGILVTEQVTRGDNRAFVSYHDLMADWRSTLRRTGESLGIDSLTVTEDPHPIDDFIDPGLNRSRVDWTDLAVPSEVTAIADAVWQTTSRLKVDPVDPDATAEMDRLHDQYDQLLHLALGLTMDEFSVELERHREDRAALKQRQEQRVAELRGQVTRLEDELAAARRSLTERVIRRLRRR